MTSRVHYIRSRRQLAALAAAPRQEVVDVLASLGTASVAELGAALGRPADALYFHLRALTRAGLVRKVQHLSGGRSKGALYRTVSPQLQLQYEPRKVSNRKAVSAIVASMLRLTTRDFRDAFQGYSVVTSGPHRELWGLRRVGPLSREGLARVNRRIQKLGDGVSLPRRRGRLYAVTVVLTPLVHRTKPRALTKRSPRT